MASSVKVYLFGGKGGVGKTTLSGACALSLSRRGVKTLLISTDPAHSLSDLFSTPVGGSLKEIRKNLHCLEIDPRSATEIYMKSAMTVAESLFSPEVLDRMKPAMESLLNTPGLEDSAIIDSLAGVITENLGEFGAFIVDTAPTGHTVAMLKTVVSSGKWFEVLIQNRIQSVRLKEMAGERRSEEKVLEILEKRRKKFEDFSRILISQDTLFVPVMIPEKLSIEETSRLIESLKNEGVRVRKIVINKVLPDSVSDAFLRKRKDQEIEYLKDIETRFKDFERIMIPLLERDVHGIENLEKLEVYAEALLK